MMRIDQVQWRRGTLGQRLLALSLGTLSALSTLSAQAAAAAEEPRWTKADEVRVRSGPSAEHKVLGTLLRGTNLILLDKTEQNGFCLIQGDGQYGYVACQFLSAELVPRAKAGENGVPANQRWAGGNPLTVRDAPRLDATVITRLHLNNVVTLLRENAGGGYCEIQTATMPSGFTACRFLVNTPVILANVRGETSASLPASPDYNPERAFWLTPGWSQLEAYVNSIKDAKTKKGSKDPWPKDEALEKMKAHLALGIYGAKPAAYVDWAVLKKAVAQNLDLIESVKPAAKDQKKNDPEQLKRQQKIGKLVADAETALGIGSPYHSAESGETNPTDIVRLVRDLEFSSISPSLFQKETDLAPGHESTSEISGRFGIIYRQIVSPRPKPKPTANAEEDSHAGLYDMQKRTQVLVRSVLQVRLFRDGKISSAPSQMRKVETLWGEVDGPMCEGWEPGFSYGDADTPIWRYFAEGTPHEPTIKAMQQNSRKTKPKDSIYYFYVPTTFDHTQAKVTSSTIKLNRQQAGFVGGNHLYYDLNQDGVADIAIWEGSSKGPGHLAGVTTTDDRWYRLVLVNINGLWKVLGTDTFSYGCGC